MGSFFTTQVVGIRHPGLWPSPPASWAPGAERSASGLASVGVMPHSSGFGSASHLARRFFGSLWPAGPSPAGEAWARRWLISGEADVWASMSGPDRRHTVGVAHRAASDLGNADGAGVPREFIAAALLHDSGKVDAALGTFGRVGATVVAMAAGRVRVAAWGDQEKGWRARAGRYVRHDEIGARLLTEAGSDPFTVAWAGEHHLPEQRWSVDANLGHALKAADDD